MILFGDNHGNRPSRLGQLITALALVFALSALPTGAPAAMATPTATSTITAGASKVISVPATAGIHVGSSVFVENEVCVVTAVVANTSFTVSNAQYGHTNPVCYVISQTAQPTVQSAIPASNATVGPPAIELGPEYWAINLVNIDATNAATLAASYNYVGSVA